MSNEVGFARKSASKGWHSYALLIISILGLGSAGCSGLVNANNSSSGGGSPTPLTISSVQAAAPSTSGFQVDWATNIAANSAVDYGTSASYGSTTPVNSAMVTSHQVGLTSLKTATLYHYRVRSTDASNVSAASGDMTFATAGDTTPPTVSITSPAANATLSGTVSLVASATDNVAVANVQFKVDSANVGAAVTTVPYSYSLSTNTLSNGNHVVTAVATDTAGNTATSAGVTVKVSNTATAAPSITSLNPTSGLVGASVTITGANFGTTQGTSTVKFNGTAATPTSWSATSIVARVPAGATTGSVVVTVGGVASNAMSFTVQADTTAPTVPTGLTATAISSSQINLSWTASTDNVGVTGYNIYRGGTKIGTSLGATYQDTGLAASTSYSYTVAAFDAAGNTSAQSAGASATTLAASSGGGLPSTLGWYQIPNTQLQSVCPPDNYAGSGYAFSSNCKNVVAAWSGGIADTTRNRLIIWGGGHTDYSGNEIYALDLNSLTLTRLNNPAIPVSTDCGEALTGPTPNSRHTYDDLAYSPSVDQMLAVTGSKAPCGAASNGTWTLNLSNLQWTQRTPAGTAPNYTGGLAATSYDPNTNKVFIHTESYGQFATYDFASNTYTILHSGSATDYHETSVIDPTRKLFFLFGNGTAWKIDISGNDPTYTWKSIQGSGCSGFMGQPYPGLAFDTVQKLVVGWAGGNTVYLYNPDTDSCTSVTYPNGPGAQQAAGTYKRFSYFPALNVFALVNSVTQNAYALRLTSASGTGGGSGPVISGVSVTGITTTGANISWTTDVPATTQVEYGLTTAYGTLTALNSTLATSHSQALTGLTIGTLYHYRVHSKNSSGVESISGDAVFTTNSTADTTPPTVSMSAPASGATLSGTVTVSASASDNVGVASVQFTLDGANLGTPLAASPYQMTWDTTTTGNGIHLVSAVAKDAAGNTATAAAVSITVSNSTSGAAAAALQDFNARCTAAGVVFCQAFDDSTGFQQNVNIFPNATYAGVYPAMDTTTARSGTSSMRIDIPPFQGANMGKFDSAFTPMGGANSDFYFQVATRISPEMLTNFANRATTGWPTWKNHSFFTGNSSCIGMSLVTNINNDGLVPSSSMNCGYNGFYTNGGTPPYLIQQGDYNCPYRGETPSVCFYWPTDTWITFYYHVHVGNYNSATDNYDNSLVEAWVSVDGQPYKKWIDLPGWSLSANGQSQFDHLELYPYMTGKDATIGGYPTAHVWYDELIVSKQPIAAPAVPPALP